MNNTITPLTFPDNNSNSDFSDVTAGHVAIKTTEYSGLIKWYLEKLDFRLVREFSAGEMRLAFLAPPNTNQFLIEVLDVANANQLNKAEEKSGYDHLCFNVENLDRTMKKLGERNVEIVRHFAMPAIGKRIAFISDPFGNKIEFCEDMR